MTVSSTARPTILLVDDNTPFRSKLREILVECNYLVLEVSNGKEALEAASSECPDLIVMDLNMPIMDGLTASQLIRKLGGRYERVPILAISTFGPEMRDPALRAGCNDFFNKTESDRLILAIEHILNP